MRAATVITSLLLLLAPLDIAAADVRQLRADTTVTTPSGATFQVSRGWHVTRADDLIVIEEPERELAVAFVDISAQTAEEAIARAWSVWKPGFARAVRTRTQLPPAGGWDEIAQIDYETGAEERRVVMAVARRRGTLHYVTLVDGLRAAVQRRKAQLDTSVGSLRAMGASEENLAGRTARKLDEKRAEKLLAFAEAARREAELPGVALAVVQDGRIVLEKGLGVRARGGSEAVTPDTLFMIGSMTKALTSLLMARLVDRGAFSWDTPVRLLLPGFALGDEEITRQTTMAHTVCACAGLPRREMELVFDWQWSTPQSRIDRLQGMKPTTGFGETFQDNILMVAAGGYAAARTRSPSAELRRAYIEAMVSEVLAPLGMTSTTFNAGVARQREHAHPHGRNLAHQPEPIPLEMERFVESAMPAGGAWSTVRDVSRWLLLELGNGRIDGTRIVTAANLHERRRPRVRISDGEFYGLGLVGEDMGGLSMFGHDGNTFGFSAEATFWPEHGLGLVVLVNASDAHAYAAAVRRRLVELLFDAEEQAETNWTLVRKRVLDLVAARLAEVTITPDAALVEPLLGPWTNPRLGEIHIRRDAEGFLLDAGEWQTRLVQHTDASGVRKLMAASAPLTGLAFWPREHEGRPALLFETAQQTYWFER